MVLYVVTDLVPDGVTGGRERDVELVLYIDVVLRPGDGVHVGVVDTLLHGVRLQEAARPRTGAAEHLAGNIQEYW